MRGTGRGDERPRPIRLALVIEDPALADRLAALAGAHREYRRLESTRSHNEKWKPPDRNLRLTRHLLDLRHFRSKRQGGTE
jgi:hypothetical protein